MLTKNEATYTNKYEAVGYIYELYTHTLEIKKMKLSTFYLHLLICVRVLFFIVVYC